MTKSNFWKFYRNTKTAWQLQLSIQSYQPSIDINPQPSTAWQWTRSLETIPRYNARHCHGSSTRSRGHYLHHQHSGDEHEHSIKLNDKRKIYQFNFEPGGTAKSRWYWYKSDCRVLNDQRACIMIISATWPGVPSTWIIGQTTSCQPPGVLPVLPLLVPVRSVAVQNLSFSGAELFSQFTIDPALFKLRLVITNTLPTIILPAKGVSAEAHYSRLILENPI